MMTMIRLLVPAVIAISLGATWQSFGDSKQEEAKEKSVQLSEVPQPARDAAQKTLGSAPTAAKIVIGTNPQEYELEGKSKSGKEMGVHVRADGTVVKTEAEDEDED